MHQSRVDENSCMKLKQNHKNWPSGYYWINIEGTSVSAYCDMETDGGKLQYLYITKQDDF